MHLDKASAFELEVHHFIEDFTNTKASHVVVKTSGSTGVPKEILVSKHAMLNSAKRTNDVLGLKSGDTAVLCLPLKYIAAKMMVVRSLERHLNLQILNPCANPLKQIEHLNIKGSVLLAITPHQLHEILSDLDSRRKLSQISHVLVGGGAIPSAVEYSLRSFDNKIYATYGMTETLSHIALRLISGACAQRFFYTLPGVEVSQTELGCLVVRDELTFNDYLVTNDVVEFSEDGGFVVKGRVDNVVNSGGVKLQIEELESVLEKTVLEKNCVLTYVFDEKYGQALTLLYALSLTEDEVKHICKTVLKGFELPKYYFKIENIPYTENGKIARLTAHQLAEQLKS